MSATREQIQELAGTIASQAEAIADGRVPEDQLRAAVALLHNNTDTLRKWVPNIRERDRDGYCTGCGEVFSGARGLKAHQTGRFVGSACAAARRDAPPVGDAPL
jgi:hypothetical protein